MDGPRPRWTSIPSAALRAAWTGPVAAFAVALAIRVYWVRHWILPPYGDQASLERFAGNVAHGLLYGTHGAYWPPAFVFLAGAVERAFGTGHHLLAVRTADAVLGALAAALTADLARRLLRSPPAGLAAGLLWAVYVPAVYYTDAFLAVTLGTLMLLAVCDAGVAYGDRPGGTRLAVVGLLLGLAALTKPTELPLVVPLGLQWGLRGSRGFDWAFALRSAAATLALALVVNVPWTLRNLHVTGAPVFVDMNGGINFYIAHNPRATGEFVDLGPANPVLLRGAGYDAPETGALALRAGVAYFAAHPGADAREAATVLRYFWTMRDPDIATYGGEIYRLAARLRAPAWGFGVVRDLGLLGAAFWARRWRRMAVLPATVLGYCGGLALLFFAPRFRLPVEPLLAISAAWAAVRVSAAVAAEWRRAAPVGAGHGARTTGEAAVADGPQRPAGRAGPQGPATRSAAMGRPPGLPETSAGRRRTPRPAAPGALRIR